MANDILEGITNGSDNISSFLKPFKGTKGSKLDFYITATEQGWKLYQKAKAWAEQKREFKIQVNQSDPLFFPLYLWVAEHSPEGDMRNIIASAQTKYEYTGDVKVVKELTLHAAAGSTVFLDVNGHQVKFDTLETDERNERNPRQARDLCITMTTQNSEARDAVVRMLNSLLVTERRCARLYVQSPWGDGWERMGEIDRTLDTVFLKKGQKESLVEDVDLFLESRESYARFGLPWRHGMLLHGPPGTGKSSLPQALANHFQLDLYSLSITDLDSDTALISAVSRVPERSIVLIEDVDVADSATQEDEGEKRVTLSGLLNVLDGALISSGVLFILTTNRLDKLQSNLIRSGRMDRVEEISYIDSYQLNSMVKFFLDLEVDMSVKKGVTPSDVAGVFKSNFRSLDKVVEELKMFTE